MLVTFSCSAYANITMFGDVALQLIRMMGHTAMVPGALLAADIPAALDSLESALKAEAGLPELEAAASEDDDVPPVSLSQRAFPLMELLRAAQKEQCNVMWESGV